MGRRVKVKQTKITIKIKRRQIKKMETNQLQKRKGIITEELLRIMERNPTKKNKKAARKSLKKKKRANKKITKSKKGKIKKGKRNNRTKKNKRKSAKKGKKNNRKAANKNNKTARKVNTGRQG